jgi:hypothetical protein
LKSFIFWNRSSYGYKGSLCSFHLFIQVIFCPAVIMMAEGRKILIKEFIIRKVFVQLLYLTERL